MSIDKKGDTLRNIDRTQEIFEKHGGFIHSIICFNVRNEVLAEDLFQDLFLSLILRPIPEEVQNVRGFLYRRISGNIKDAHRRIYRYQRKLCRYAEHSTHTEGNCPEKSLMEIEEINKMFKLIEKHLPQNEALAVTLRYRNNYDTTETAEKMGVKSRTVSRYVSAGLTKIRRVLGKKREGQL